MHLRRRTRACATREIHSTTLDCWCGCGSGCFCCSKRALLPHTVVVAEGEQRRILGLRMVQVLTATMFALFLLAMVYRFEGIGTPLRSLELGEHGLGPATRLMEWFPSPVPRKYLQAFDWALQHTSRPAYFHGEFSQRAVILLYFPLLLLMKPPLWLHALVLMATIGFLFQKSRNWPTVLFLEAP